MADRPIIGLLQRIQQQAQAAGRPSPIADRLLGVFGPQQPAQTQGGPPAVPQPGPAPSAPASAYGSVPNPSVPMQRPSSQSPAAAAMPMARPPSPMAQTMPMERPVSGAVPMPPPNPDRVGNFMPQQAGNAPVTRVGQEPLPPVGAMNATPVYGPGMAVPRGTSRNIADFPVTGGNFDNLLARFPGVQGGGMEGALTQAALQHIGNAPPPYEGGPGLYGYDGMGGIPRVMWGSDMMNHPRSAMGKIDPAVIQALLASPQAQGMDPYLLQQVIAQLQGPGV